ncbi:DUF4192 domain-containing protein [Actinomadura kijaniata]|uniref:DUF4192 domain-containing protein n=1 Tax=Actinomadura kijaniata TaxID=46161 RepID=UPI00083670D3|nr:DUF4192 domain-containing protein [Actinomadura kijaniata]
MELPALTPVTGTARKAMQESTRRAEKRLRAYREQTAAPHALNERLRTNGTRFLTELFQRLQNTTTPPTEEAPATDDEVAWLLVLLEVTHLSDEALIRMAFDPDSMPAYVRFWSDLARRAEPAYRAAPAALLGYAAFLNGDTALADAALEQAYRTDRRCGLAMLLDDLIRAGMTPATLRSVLQQRPASNPPSGPR